MLSICSNFSCPQLINATLFPLRTPVPKLLFFIPATPHPVLSCQKHFASGRALALLIRVIDSRNFFQHFRSQQLSRRLVQLPNLIKFLLRKWIG